MRNDNLPRSLLALVAAALFCTATHAQVGEESGPELAAAVEGVLAVTRAYDISTEVDNRIDRIHFVEGQPVKKGDLLVEFDTKYLDLDTRRADAAVRRVLAQLKLAEEVRDRRAVLRETDSISEALYLEAQRNAEAAAADLQLARIDAEKARTLLANAKVHAPFDGQVSAPRFRENATVEVEANGEVATLYALDPIHFRFNVSYERLLARLRAQESEEELVDQFHLVLKYADGTEYEHAGRLITLSFAVDTTGTITGIAEFRNPDRVLRPGMKLKADAYWKVPGE